MKLLSTNSIVAFFNLFVKLLEARAKHVEQKFHEKNAQIEALIVQREEHALERARATTIAANIKKLVA